MDRRCVMELFPLPPYCFAPYAYEESMANRVGLNGARRWDVIDAARERAIGYCDGSKLQPGPPNSAKCWALMYEDLEGIKCWSLIPKRYLKFVPDQGKFDEC